TCRLFRRLSPPTRCWLWRLAYLKLFVALFCPSVLALPVLPAFSRPVTPALGVPPHAPPGTRPPKDAAANLDAAGGPPAFPTSPRPHVPTSPRPHSPIALLSLLGLAAYLGRAAGDWLAARRLRRRSPSFVDAAALEECGALC